MAQPEKRHDPPLANPAGASPSGALPQLEPRELLLPLLQEGRVEEFNSRRPKGRLDFAGFDLAGCDLAGADLRDADLTGANIEGTTLRGANLSGAVLRQANLIRADLEGADLTKAHCEFADLREAKLARALLDEAHFERVRLERADLSDVSAKEAKFVLATFHEATLERGDFTGAVFRGAYLTKARAAQAVLTQADLSDTDLSDAELSGAKAQHAAFRRALLDRTSLVGADCTQATFSRSWGTGALFTRATLTGSKFHHVDLVQSTFDDAELTGFDGRHACFDKSLFRRATAARANFEHALLREAKLSDADLTEARFNQAELRRADLSDSGLHRAHFDSVVAPNAVFDRADLREARFHLAFLSASRFERADCEGAVFFQAQMNDVRFNEANLVRANFKLAVLERPNFTGAFIEHITVSETIAVADVFKGAKAESPVAGLFEPKRFARTAQAAPGTAAKELPDVLVLSSNIVAKHPEVFEQAMHKLDQLVGLDEIKEKVRSLAAALQVDRAKETMGLPVTPRVHHFTMEGNTGTGKTTVARILSQVLYSLGYLEKGHLVEVGRAGLVAEYEGQTEAKVLKRVEEAMGGFLLVDEIYALTRGGKGGFGQVALEALLKEQEDRRDKFVVGGTGYRKEMQEFFDANSGLDRRYPTRYYFPDYTVAQLTEILVSRFMGGAKLSMAGGDLAVPYVFCALLKMTKTKNFGNAGEIRNQYEAAVERQSRRLVEQGTVRRSDLMTVTRDDFAFEKTVGMKPDEIPWSEMRWVLRNETGTVIRGGITAGELGRTVIDPVTKEEREVGFPDLAPESEAQLQALADAVVRRREEEEERIRYS